MEIRLIKALGAVAVLAAFGFFSLFPQLKPDWIHLGRGRRVPRAVGVATSVPTPQSADACFQRAAEYITQEQWDLAITQLNEVLRLEPDDLDARHLRGVAWHGKREFEKAVADLDAVLRGRPQDIDALYARGEARAELGQITSALADFDAAIRLVPDDAAALGYRGNLREESRDYRGALADYQQAARLEPDDPWALNNLAWVLAVAPQADVRNGSLALEAAKRAVENDGAENWETLDTLAAACAENGDFAAAQRCQTEAIRLAPPEAHSELQDRLELYRKQQPFRLPAQDPKPSAAP